MHMLGNGRPPAALGGLGQASTGFASSMVPVLQARPGSSMMGQSYHGQLATSGMPASSYMPIMQQQVNSAQSGATHVPSMQPMLQNGALFPVNSAQGYQFGQNLPQFHQQPAPQQQQQQQHMQQPAQFGRPSSNDQTQTGFVNSRNVVPHGQPPSAQNV